MEDKGEESISQPTWRKMAYGGMQPGYDDNYNDKSFLEGMVMDVNVVKRDMLKVVQDSVSISQYICVVVLVLCVWTCTLESAIGEANLLLLDAVLLGSGLLVFLLTAERLLLYLLCHYIVNISYFIGGLYIVAPIRHTLTRPISSDSIWALILSLLVLHLFLHDYSGSSIRPHGAPSSPTLTSNISLNASVVASVLFSSRLPSRLLVFAVVLFSLQVFLFALIGNVLHKEALVTAASLLFFWFNDADIGNGGYVELDAICILARRIGFCHGSVSILVYKHSTVQV